MFFPPVACLQEFEVIAQIKLLQLASNNYSFTQDSHFREWFAGVEKLSEAERSVRSLLCGEKTTTCCLLFKPAVVLLLLNYERPRAEQRDHESHSFLQS